MPRMFYKQTPEHVAKRLASRRTKGANIMMEYSARSLEQLADHLYGLGQRARASIRDDEKSFKRIELVARACAFESAADLLRNAEIKGDEYDRGFADGVKAANRALTAGIEELKRCLIKPKEQVS